MKICIPFYGNANADIMRACVQSIRKHMPALEVHQWTDLDTPLLADSCTRMKVPNYAEFMHLQMYAMPEEPYIRCDSDVVFQDSVLPVFDADFDLATAPHGDARVAATMIGRMYPLTGAVTFYKHKIHEFAEDMILAYSRTRRDGWMDTQFAFNVVCRSGKYRVLKLDAHQYNYTPVTKDDRPASAKLIHYKGKRKAWMLDAPTAATA